MREVLASTSLAADTTSTWHDVSADMNIVIGADGNDWVVEYQLASGSDITYPRAVRDSESSSIVILVANRVRVVNKDPDNAIYYEIYAAE